MESQIAVVVAIVFTAGLTRATFGFGEALVAMPLLSLVIDVRVAAALIAITSMFNGVAILSTSWQNIQWAATWRLLLAACLGIPLGVYGLIHIPETAVKLVLAAVVMLFAAYNLLRPGRWRLNSDASAFGFGLVAGILGGAYNTLGPALVIFGTLRGWDAQRFRTTLQSVFLPASFFVGLNHFAQGLWTERVFQCLVFSLPALLLAVLLGTWLHRRVESRRFARYVFCLLLAVGVMLVASVLVDPAAVASSG